jgi:hypothetical protein
MQNVQIQTNTMCKIIIVENVEEFKRALTLVKKNAKLPPTRQVKKKLCAFKNQRVIYLCYKTHV